MVKCVPKGNELHIGLFAGCACFFSPYERVIAYYTLHEYVINLGKVADCFTFGLSFCGLLAQLV